MVCLEHKLQECKISIAKSQQQRSFLAVQVQVQGRESLIHPLGGWGGGLEDLLWHDSLSGLTEDGATTL